MKQIITSIIFIILFSGCRDEYEFPLRENDLSLLVVEGVLNAGQGPTTITLSRTVKVNESTNFKPELLANLTVEGEDGGSYPLVEEGNGRYTSPQLSLVFDQKYRLRIRTNDNREYLSDYVVAKKSPEIDAVTWRKVDNGVFINANTHDPSNNTRYYKWDYDETWEIRSVYEAEYRWVEGSTIIPAPRYNNICWKYNKSSTINLATTTQLESDVVNEAALLFIPAGSEKLGFRYSILLKQQALTKEAYEYYNLMKKNTESVGSIFDPQPSELRGNFKCVSNPEENVIGYLSASSTTEKRFFLTAQETGWIYQEDCPYVLISNDPEIIRQWMPRYLPFSAETQGGGITDYFIAPRNCVDCTTRGGDLTKPSYW